jgi:hypothetical protein
LSRLIFDGTEHSCADSSLVTLHFTTDVSGSDSLNNVTLEVGIGHTIGGLSWGGASWMGLRE